MCAGQRHSATRSSVHHRQLLCVLLKCVWICDEAAHSHSVCCKNIKGKDGQNHPKCCRRCNRWWKACVRQFYEPWSRLSAYVKRMATGSSSPTSRWDCAKATADWCRNIRIFNRRGQQFGNQWKWESSARACRYGLDNVNRCQQYSASSYQRYVGCGQYLTAKRCSAG